MATTISATPRSVELPPKVTVFPEAQQPLCYAKSRTKRSRKSRRRRCFLMRPKVAWQMR
jgi:hypothetical protein